MQSWEAYAAIHHASKMEAYRRPMAARREAEESFAAVLATEPCQFGPCRPDTGTSLSVRCTVGLVSFVSAWAPV